MTRRQTQERIQRLKAAIGEGPHAASINTTDHLRTVLEMMGDQAALEVLRKAA